MKQETGKNSGERNLLQRIRKNPLFPLAAFVLVAAVIIGTGYYWYDLQSKIYTEKAEIRAPIISIGPLQPGVLNKLYVSEGDVVYRNQRLAEVGSTTLTAKTKGTIISVKNTPGQLITPQDSVVTMIDPSELRLVGRVPEDKNLKDILPGQRVVFTVDAFGSKEYAGTVEKVALSARQSDIVFSISDKRAVRDFEVTAVFDVSSYPELKNGMSAKMWIYK